MRDEVWFEALGRRGGLRGEHVDVLLIYHCVLYRRKDIATAQLGLISFNIRHFDFEILHRTSVQKLFRRYTHFDWLICVT
jgi:hypothetical protein